MRNLLKDWLRSPTLAAVNIVFGVIAGLVVATFHEELIDAVPMVWLRRGMDIQYGEWSWPAFWFWSLLLVFALIWALRERVATEDRRSEIEKLEQLIETVAPPDFLTLYENLYISIAPLAGTLSRTESDGAQDVRLILDTLIQLAAQWDYKTATADDVYRANVMKDLDSTDWNNEQIAAAGQPPLGEAGWTSATALADGGLWVDQTLATTYEANGEADSDVKPLLLLYSRKNEINLGGAPQAFVDSQVQYVQNTSDIIERFPSGLSQDSKKIAKEFYNNDSKAKSIISLPIPGDKRLVGVLNIYRNTVGIMGSEARAQNFARLVAPFTQILGRIVSGIDLND